MSEKIRIDEFTKEVPASKETDVYSIHDRVGEYLTDSVTVLHPYKETRGHDHEGQEEIYFFVRGSGVMQLGDKRFDVTVGDLVKIPSGVFHQVINPTGEELAFYCVFNGAPARPK